MTNDPAALLTQTQRQRIQDQFAGMEDEKRRRDQQRIRERIAAGVDDFSLLVSYPDEQLEMAFDDYSDEELHAVLADGHLVLERIRESQGLDRDQLIQRIQGQTQVNRDHSADLGTLEHLDFETTSERRQRIIAEIEEQRRPSLWGRRANRLLRATIGFFIPVLLMWSTDQFLGTALFADYKPVWAVLLAISLITLAGTLGIKSAQLLKHDLLPPVQTVVTEPEEAFSTMYNRYISRPHQALRQSWEKL